jgi:hypothetical protein
MTIPRVVIARCVALVSRGEPLGAVAAEVAAGRTPDGQPDIQGTWLNFDATPFEAPAPVARAPRRRQGGRRAKINPAPEFADHTHR